MLDIGWPELLVVAIVLIIVVGPKDLPQMLRAFGRTTKKLRGMASEFRGQFDEALREAELGDVKKTIDDARKLNPMQNIRDAVNPLREAVGDIKSDLDHSMNAPAASQAASKVKVPEPSMKLADGPPQVKPAADGAAVKTAGKPASKAGTASKAVTKPSARSPAKTGGRTRAKPSEDKAVATKPAAAKAPAKSAKAAKTPAKPASAKTSQAKSSEAKSSQAKSSEVKAPARARKPKNNEGSA